MYFVGFGTFCHSETLCHLPAFDCISVLNMVFPSYMYILFPFSLFFGLQGLGPKGGALSQTVPGCVTRHTRHDSVTHFRPISGNIMQVTLVTSPKHVYNSHTKETYFP